MNLFKEIRVVVALVWILSRIHCYSAQQCFDDGNEFCIDENDILSVDLLPGSFLFAVEQPVNNATTNLSNDVADGSIHNALNEMEYHR